MNRKAGRMGFLLDIFAMLVIALSITSLLALFIMLVITSPFAAIVFTAIISTTIAASWAAERLSGR